MLCASDQSKQPSVPTAADRWYPISVWQAKKGWMSRHQIQATVRCGRTPSVYTAHPFLHKNKERKNIMKKNKLLVILSLALTLSCLLSALSMNVFAGALENTHYVTLQEYTAVTQTYGYSSAIFTGNYYPNGDGTNNAILAVEARGGRTDEFTTELMAELVGGGSVSLNSDTEGTRTLSATLVSYTMNRGDFGSSLQSCISKTNFTEDTWERYYYSEWGNDASGWTYYFQDPET